MLDLETIKKNTLWVARMVSGVRFTGIYDEIKKLTMQQDKKCSVIKKLTRRINIWHYQT